MSVSQRVGVIPIGEIPHIVPKVVAAHISGFLELKASVLRPLPNPAYALDKQRLQFNAGVILTELESRLFEDFDKIVAIVGVDLFIPIFTHVFGEARQGGRIALVSLFRLGNDPGDTDQPAPKGLERAAKVALHELGHLFDLTHCDNEKCLMHFSGDLEALDRLPFSLCRYCRRFFREARSAKR
jgi:archaemetzincin